ncbi:MAG: hypothetical protein H0U59_12310 [Gemmatimonadaceae bacterium]|nr:hypothetical protein [Gemmatimonadaceae bacterium]
MSDELGKRRKPLYILNRNEGVDVLHRDPGERCNQDDADGRQTIDAATADALLNAELDPVRRCGHCWP